MWADNETDRDFLNFAGVSDTVAEIILQANGKPISIGVSGQWGMGKSSMIKLIRTALESRDDNEDERKFLFVEFNAWLYQGYDDARAALMDVIVAKLADAAGDDEDLLAKAKSLLKRVNWLRLGKMVASSAVSLSLGLPPTGLLGGLWDLSKRVLGKNDSDATVDASGDQDGEEDESDSLVEEAPSPSKEIQALRESFEETLAEMDVTLVVLIDDLDRCLPKTTISTLEAIRLFLFLKNTAFVIAADDAMIKHAVSKHFKGIDDTQVVNYFDKLVQVPVRVPPLGTQEVRAYLFLLFVEDSSLDDEVKEKIRVAVGERLRESWQGKHVDRAFMQTLHPSFPSKLLERFDTADSLAPIMTRTSGIQGNPRLIKRFLNALSIRMSQSRSQGVNVDEAVLTKLMLFERLGGEAAYKKIVTAVTTSTDGKPAFLAGLEKAAAEGLDKIPDELFGDEFSKEWLTLEPALADRDLRGAVYVSRDHLPLITADSGLSDEAKGLLAALIAQPGTAKNFQSRVSALSRPDKTVFMDRLLTEAKREQEWGTPDILTACMVVAQTEPSEAERLSRFFRTVPVTQIKPGLIPRLQDEPWAAQLLDHWVKQEVSAPVKNAIKKSKERK